MNCATKRALGKEPQLADCERLLHEFGVTVDMAGDPIKQAEEMLAVGVGMSEWLTSPVG